MRWYVVVLLGLVVVPASAAGHASALGHPERGVVRVTAQGCSAVDTFATGWMSQNGLVVSVAHAVRGSTSVTVDGAPAKVVALDNRADVAVLAPELHIGATPLPSAAHADTSHVWLAHLSDARRASLLTSIGASATFIANVDEPVDGTTYARRAFAIAVAVDHGDSGAPVVDARGRVVGMTFATSRDGSAVAYAVAVDDIRGIVRDLDIDAPSVDTGRCN